MNPTTKIVVPQGLKGWWRFDEGTTGATAIDSSGNGISGTPTGSPTYVSSVPSRITFTDPYCIVLNGSSQYFDMGANYSYEYTQPWSMSVWVNSSSFTNVQSIMGKQQNSTNFTGYDFQINTSAKLTINIQFNTSDRIIATGSTTLSTGTWYHVVATYSGSGAASGVKLYVNGVAETMSVTSDTLGGNSILNAVNFKVGSRDSGGIPFSGNLDDVRFYNYILSQAEITAIYSGAIFLGNAPPINNNLKLWWSFQEGSGTTTADKSGNGNTGTLLNSPTWTAGIIGEGISFSAASSQSVRITSPVGISTGFCNNYTASMWVKTPSFTTQSDIWGAGDTANGDQILAILTTGHFAAATYHTVPSLTNDQVVGTKVLSTNVWYFVVVVRDQSITNKFSIYVNGVLDNNITMTGTNASFGNTCTFYAAQRATTSGQNYANAVMDDLRFYNRAMTASEISYMYFQKKKQYG